MLARLKHVHGMSDDEKSVHALGLAATPKKDGNWFKITSDCSLFAALQAEGIKFMVADMSAANLQGVLASTVDVDVWIDLPARQYMRVVNLCRNLNASVRSPNKVFLSDETPVDFIYESAASRFLKKNVPAPNVCLFTD